jgi:hypothetical protein
MAPKSMEFPPSGVVLYVDDEIPVVDLCAMLRRVVIFLQSLELSPKRLRLYDDWWQHDGLHFTRHTITFHELFQILETPRAIFEATRDDDEVFVGIAPEDARWYLRFRAEWDADYQNIVGRFSVTLPPESAPILKGEIAPSLSKRFREESAEAFYARTIK